MAKGLELAKAYVQIVPSADGIKGSIAKVMDGEAASAGGSAGASIASKIKSMIAAAGIGATLSKAITEGADLQQSIGGIETLFKDSADEMKQYANEAYKTAGISANSYMEQATSFSASLLSSLGGDTKAAAKAANQAIIDMADNSNKMGTSLENIQNAYQGFAKQNYTMLDNLKLGYGGTKTEMERLLADATKLSGVKYNIENLDDVYSAIHVIQEEMGITGATVNEAEATLSGSLQAMSAAATNFLGNLTLGEDIRPSLQALVGTTSTFLFGNLLPAVGNIIAAIPGTIGTVIQETSPIILEQGRKLYNHLLDGIRNQFPGMLESGTESIIQFITGILNNYPEVVTTAGGMMIELLGTIYDQIPNVLESGGEILLSLIQGIVNNGPELLVAAGVLLGNLLKKILSHAPQILESGITLIGKLAAGLIRAIPDIVAKIPEIISKIREKFEDTDWRSLGRNIISGIARGITNGLSSIIDAAKDVAKNALNAAKNALGIHSPSAVFRDEVGKMIDLGLAGGIEGNLKPINDAMQELKDTTLGEITPQMYTPSLFMTDAKHGNTESELITRILEVLMSIDEKTQKELSVWFGKRQLATELGPDMSVVLEQIRQKEARR